MLTHKSGGRFLNSGSMLELCNDGLNDLFENFTDTLKAIGRGVASTARCCRASISFELVSNNLHNRRANNSGYLRGATYLDRH